MRCFAAPQAGGGRAGVLGQLVARHPELLRPALKKPARAFEPLPTPKQVPSNVCKVRFRAGVAVFEGSRRRK